MSLKIKAAKRLMAKNDDQAKAIIKEIFKTNRIVITPKAHGVSGMFSVPSVIHTSQLEQLQATGVMVNGIEFEDGEFVVDFAAA